MQLQKALFPIGKYPKEEVRKMAERFALPNAHRKDSQGICFLGKIPFDQFIQFHLGTLPGKLIEERTRTVLGTHEGFWYYTVGQRKGIKLSGGPWYVTRKNTESNDVFIAHGNQYLNEGRESFIVKDINWITEKPEKTNLDVKVRHGEKKYQATLKFLTDESCEVTFSESDSGLAEGQFAVFYDGGYCLGGGVIS